MPNDAWEEIIGSSGWFSPFNRCGPGGGGATWLSSRWGRCCDSPLCLYLFQSKGSNSNEMFMTMKLPEKILVFYIFYTFASMEVLSQFQDLHGFPGSLYLFFVSHGKTPKLSAIPSNPAPKVLSSTLGTDHPLLLVAKPGEEKGPPRDGWWVKHSRWWQLKHFLFSPRTLGRWSNLTIIFFKGVETTK